VMETSSETRTQYPVAPEAGPEIARPGRSSGVHPSGVRQALVRGLAQGCRAAIA
jgi:hypothetical protein